MGQTFLVALSGGVDSAVTAAMLLRQGHQVIGVTMDIGYGNAGLEAAAVADSLNIKHHIINVEQSFKDIVIADFLDSYLRGETPNPCVICNQRIKFKVFEPLMKELSADYLATGHYVQKGHANGRYFLYKAAYQPKDQSYMLYTLSQDVLARVAFPLGQFSKDQIRGMARDWDLDVAEKKDSQDICFIPDGDYRQFLGQKKAEEIIPGDVVDKEGHVLGQHRGLAYYTIGQRKGLGLALNYPAYVVALDRKNNRLILGKEEDIFSRGAMIDDYNFQLWDELTVSREVEVKVRYKSAPVMARISMEKGRLLLEFANPEKAVTPGQSAVFYQGNILVGGGKIAETF